jgi:hypothetical protein
MHAKCALQKALFINVYNSLVIHAIVNGLLPNAGTPRVRT